MKENISKLRRRSQDFQVKISWVVSLETLSRSTCQSVPYTVKITSISEILKWKRLMICKWREPERFHLTTLQDYMSATDSSTTGSMSDTTVLAQAT